MSTRHLTLDLHPLAKQGRAIDEALEEAVKQAVVRKVKKVEIIPGKGSGQLKKRVVKWLQQPSIKKHYHRLEVDSKNHGRVFVHFQW